MERFHRTLKDFLFESMKDRDTTVWLDNGLLDKIINDYNNRVSSERNAATGATADGRKSVYKRRRIFFQTHSSTRMKPSEVGPSDVPALLRRLYGDDWIAQPNARFKLLLGDEVLVAKAALSIDTAKQTFAKGSVGGFFFYFLSTGTEE